MRVRIPSLGLYINMDQSLTGSHCWQAVSIVGIQHYLRDQSGTGSQ